MKEIIVYGRVVKKYNDDENDNRILIDPQVSVGGWAKNEYDKSWFVVPAADEMWHLSICKDIKFKIQLDDEGNAEKILEDIAPDVTGEEGENALYYLIEANCGHEDAKVSIIKGIAELIKNHNGSIWAWADREEAEAELNSTIGNRIKNKEERVKKILENIRAYKKLYMLGKQLGKHFRGSVVKNLVKKGAPEISGNDAYKILMLDGRANIQEADYYCRNILKTDAFCPQRVWAVGYWSLKAIEQNGSTCMEINEWQTLLKSIMGKYCADPCIYIPNYLAAVVLTERFATFKKCPDGRWYIYKKHTAELEGYALGNMRRLNNTGRNWCEDVTDEKIDDIQNKLNITYTQKQREAFSLLHCGGVKCLTGLAGTGKTAVVKGLVTYWLRNRAEDGGVALLASTGMAAKVLAEKTGMEASTIHKALKIVPLEGEEGEIFSDDNIDGKLIIVDEASMIDLKTYSILLSRIASGSLVIFVGDDGQLPPVSPGQPFADILKIDKIEHTHLNEIMRNAGSIPQNASVVRFGGGHLKKDKQFEINLYNSDSDMIKDVVEKAKKDKGQVICPIKSEENGCGIINYLMQPDRAAIVRSGKRWFHKNDRIVCLQNDYDIGVCNGDIGKVVSAVGGCCEEDCDMLVDFGNATILIPRSYFQNVDLAYAITVHKSQGSEFDTVHVVLPDGPQIIMTARLLYTAITRAKKKIVIHAVRDAKLKVAGKLAGNTANLCFLNRPENTRCTRLAALY